MVFLSVTDIFLHNINYNIVHIIILVISIDLESNFRPIYFKFKAWPQPIQNNVNGLTLGYTQ
jgi:hypothetical protein